MLRGVIFFLLFVVTLSGWGMFFYQRTEILGLTRKKEMSNYAVSKNKVVVELATSGDHRGKEEDVYVGGDGEEKLNEDEKSDIIEQLQKEKQLLEKKYEDLLKRIEKIKESYQGLVLQKQEISKRLIQKEQKIQEMKAKIRNLNGRVTNLQVQLEAVKGNYSAVLSENRILRAKAKELSDVLNSLPRLKQALKDLKRRLWLERKRRIMESDKELYGNRGYIVYKGKSTLGKNSGAKIDVTLVLEENG